jgi:hypothetical protein
MKILQSFEKLVLVYFEYMYSEKSFHAQISFHITILLRFDYLQFLKRKNGVTIRAAKVQL